MHITIYNDSLISHIKGVECAPYINMPLAGFLHSKPKVLDLLNVLDNEKLGNSSQYEAHRK